MKVWIFEQNLIWSSRLAQSVRGLGHEAVLATQTTLTHPTIAHSTGTQTPSIQADVAIVNLGQTDTPELISALHAQGVPIIAHAGHKEKALLELGRGLCVQRLATNSELTYKLDAILKEFQPA